MVELRANCSLTVSDQTRILGLNRSGLYYKPALPSERDIFIKSRIDRLFTDHPEYGYRRITSWLNAYERLGVNHKAIRKHMLEMGLQAIYPRQRTSVANPANLLYPYLLKGLNITRPDQVWSIDITYIPIKSSWLYLVAVMDWYSRFVVSWRIDDTLDIDFVLDACAEALHDIQPQIMNISRRPAKYEPCRSLSFFISDQGSHFTSPKYTSLFITAGSRISMYHRGRAYDNIFIERLWRSLKYEDVYLRGYETPRETRMGIAKYLWYYNNERLHQSLNDKIPASVYCVKDSCTQATICRR
jgi:putative transposase